MEVTIEKFNPWKDSLISGILLLILGILLLVFQSEALEWIIIIAGAFMLIAGVIMIIDAMKTKFTISMVMGAILAVIGLVFIVYSAVVGELAMVLLGVGLIIVGLITLLGASGGFAVAKGSRVVSVIIGAILIIIGNSENSALDDRDFGGRSESECKPSLVIKQGSTIHDVDVSVHIDGSSSCGSDGECSAVHDPDVSSDCFVIISVCGCNLDCRIDSVVFSGFCFVQISLFLDVSSICCWCRRHSRDIVGGHDDCERTDHHGEHGDCGEQFCLPPFHIHIPCHRCN